MTNPGNDLHDLILQHVPDDGTSISKKALLALFKKTADSRFTEEDFLRTRDELIAQGLLATGRGRGASVMRPQAASEDTAPQKDNVLVLEMQEPAESDTTPARRPGKTASQSRSRNNEGKQVVSYRYDEKRKNNPQVGMVDTTSDGVEGETTWAYDPHIDPTLNFDTARAGIENLIDNALASGDETVMRQALEQLKRMHVPYLNWTGKAERTSFEVDTVSLHVHERIDPATILAAVQRRMKGAKGKSSVEFQPGLFAAPFENLPLRDAIDFYKHERDWANRLIAGDSLLVMNSLLQKESMAGRVQMIYIDPPYGIKYGSNFQPFTNKRDVKDRNDNDLTQEPEMIKAFRDTWELGIHSYLTYLRDRLLLARELLNESGSVFVQISDENVHHVRELLDEIFGSENFCSIITFQKTGSIAANLLPSTTDFLVWYAKSRVSVKYQQIYSERHSGDPSLDRYDQVRAANGRDRPLTVEEKKGGQIFEGKRFQLTSLFSDGSSGSPQSFHFQNSDYEPKGNTHWKTTTMGLNRLAVSDRIKPQGERLRYVRYAEDFNLIPLDDRWESVQIGKQTVYVVQTAERVIERCLIMTTDPGDLVLDPTCGSGTTAFVAEKWGRRWITTDTSRVAVTLAKQRLTTASYDYYDLKYPHEGLKGGFIYKTVPHVTLKSIANNPEIDEIYERMHPAIEIALTKLNNTAQKDLREWEVPFDFPEDWPEAARNPFDAFHTARQAMQQHMDASIAAQAAQEILYDQAQVAKNKLRITGPFTVEAVPFPTVLGLDEARRGEKSFAPTDIAVARSGETFRQGQWRDELLKAGIRGKGGQKLQLADLEPLPGTKYIHAVGTAAETGERIAVSFGPQHAALEQRQVEIAMREAGGLFPLPTMLVFCAFTFDPEAAKDIDNIKGITALKVQMNTDLLTEDLKKARASNESFWLMGQPDVEIHVMKDGQYQVEVHGFDYFDTKAGELQSGSKSNIAMWSLDTDYDDRSLFPKQVFFPMSGAKDGWNKLKKDIKAELNEELLARFQGTKSLPFEPGENRRIAVKMVDDRGIESLKVMDITD